MEAENTPNDKDNEISRDSNEENKKRDSNVASTTAAAREDEQLQQQQGDEVDEQHEHEESESVTKDMVTLFIGQIPKNLDDHFISSLFEKYGDVKQLNIIKDKYNNNRFKGCCFVSYATMDEAMKCIQDLNNTFITSNSYYPLQVKLARAHNNDHHHQQQQQQQHQLLKGEKKMRYRSDPQQHQYHHHHHHHNHHHSSIYINNLPNSTNEADLHSLLSTFGEIVKISIRKDQGNNNNNTINSNQPNQINQHGHTAIVAFALHSSAEMAIQAFLKKQLQLGEEYQSIHIEYARVRHPDKYPRYLHRNDMYMGYPMHNANEQALYPPFSNSYVPQQQQSWMNNYLPTPSHHHQQHQHQSQQQLQQQQQYENYYLPNQYQHIPIPDSSLPSHFPSHQLLSQENQDLYNLHQEYIPNFQPWSQPISGLPMEQPERKETQPRKSSQSDPYEKLFVGGLSPSTTDEEFKMLFSKYGKVHEAIILRHANGTSKSAGFIKFETKEEADTAIEDLHNKYIFQGSSRPLLVRYAGAEYIPHDVKLFVGQLPGKMDEEELRTLFEKYGKVVEVFIMRDPTSKLSKGAAFVRMEDDIEAATAITGLNGHILPNETHPIKVSQAHSSHSVHANKSNQSHDSPNTNNSRNKGDEQETKPKGRDKHNNNNSNKSQMPSKKPTLFSQLKQSNERHVQNPNEIHNTGYASSSSRSNRGSSHNNNSSHTQSMNGMHDNHHHQKPNASSNNRNKSQEYGLSPSFTGLSQGFMMNSTTGEYPLSYPYPGPPYHHLDTRSDEMFQIPTSQWGFGVGMDLHHASSPQHGQDNQSNILAPPPHLFRLGSMEYAVNGKGANALLNSNPSDMFNENSPKVNGD